MLTTGGHVGGSLTLSYSLNISPDPHHDINGVARGLNVLVNGVSIIGEGMGIGAPIILTRLKTIFPLSHDSKMVEEDELRKTFWMNGVSVKVALDKVVVDRAYRVVKRALAPLYINSRLFRPFYRLLMFSRDALRVKSHYHEVKPLGFVEATYRIDGDSVLVSVDLNSLKGVKLLVANELSGRLFTKAYVDGRQLDGIPPWMVVKGREVLLYSPLLRIGFRLKRIPGTVMFLGREVLGRRLDWAGVSYVATPPCSLAYEVVFERW